ncbi:condensation domain-containing protein [Phycicoccus endophyticus]|uniref:condensation domain-containing protein n=2 Tax=Phycicoccus endophyticus TaxID=1690220 RepID=UPI00140ADCA3|nr:condensation domain-containing protein [Phycicoccus endophyticus]NHI20593.1 peptide synthetase [Phycicoccus endophyticus]
MRLTNVAQMSLPPGRVRSLALAPTGPPGRRLPVSFDQGRHVGEGDRPGSWMAVAVRLSGPADEDALAEAWQAVVQRHGTLRTAFSRTGDGDLRLHEVTLGAGTWSEHPVDGHATREVLRDVLDTACRSCAVPSHRLCLVVPDADAEDPRPALVIAADHAHVDMWSLVVLVRDLLACLEDVRAGTGPVGASLPAAPAFAEHTAALEARPAAPGQVRRRWADILEAEGGLMPLFPLPLGDVSSARPEVVEVRDVLDAEEVGTLSQRAHEAGLRTIALAVSALTSATREVAHRPLRAVFPVHSRYEGRWHDACGWFITNAVIESFDPDPAACASAVKEALGLGSWPLAPILAPWGGMPQAPGMFAVSWLDTRRLPVRIDPALELQYVSARIRTDGVMVWFVVNDSGLHLRCRYPDTPQARENVGAWLDAVERALRVAAAS